MIGMGLKNTETKKLLFHTTVQNVSNEQFDFGTYIKPSTTPFFGGEAGSHRLFSIGSVVFHRHAQISQWAMLAPSQAGSAGTSFHQIPSIGGGSPIFSKVTSANVNPGVHYLGLTPRKPTGQNLRFS